METNVLEYLESASARYPNKVALQDTENRILYSDLVLRAKAIGTKITELNERNRPVIVFIDRDIESIEMFMGVVYSGNFYVPVDPKLPPERINSIIATLNPISIITKVRYEWEDELKTDAYIINFQEAIKSEINEETLRNIRETSIDTDPLYSIFTSGSTGTPKGVLISHRGVIDLVEAFQKTFEFKNDDILGNQAPFDFDVSTKDIYNAFKNGATVDVIPQRMFSFPIDLIKHLNERQVSVIIWAVSALNIVANIRAMKKIKPEFLRLVMFSGEVLPIKVLNYWKEALPMAMFVNLYGPTEITCNCTYYKVERDFELTESIPIGRAFSNTRVFLINENNEICKRGEIGELCVSGTCLALGYYNNKEKTHESFVINPLNKVYDERMYRTGDLAVQNENGEYVYVGRKDFQIKHMGHRIELPEIEIAANSIDWVKTACCIFDNEKKKIILIYQAEQECDIELISKLEQKLPKYMVPNKLIHVEKMPLNAHAKIDRQLLKKMYINI